MIRTEQVRGPSDLRPGALAVLVLQSSQCCFERLSRHSAEVCRSGAHSPVGDLEVNCSVVLTCLHSEPQHPGGYVRLNRYMAKVVLYSTSCASTLKMKTDISRVKQLLQIKKVDYEEVCCAVAAMDQVSVSQTSFACADRSCRGASAPVRNACCE